MKQHPMVGTVTRYSCSVLGTALLAAIVITPSEVQARVRLENICSIAGQREVKLTGLGLVVGLDGTGDGGTNLPTIRALENVLRQLHNPVADIRELREANNVAIVLIEATIPKTGLYKGQKIDCYISSIMGAESLRGGRLMATPLEHARIDPNETAVALASGAVIIEDPEVLTTGKISGGAMLLENFVSLTFDRENPIIHLLLDDDHASFQAASDVALSVNQEFEGNVSGEIAKPIDAGVVAIRVPGPYIQYPVEFVAEVLGIGLDNPHTEARVVVNAKTSTVVVTGEVEISPVVISHKNLTVEIGPPAPGGGGGGGSSFVTVPRITDGSEENLQQLQVLVDALNQLRVPTSDIISIIRELKRTGKLHAKYDEH